MLRLRRRALPTTLAAARAVYGERFNPLPTLKALCYYGDGDLATLPAAIRARLCAAAKSVDSTHLPRLEPLAGGLLP